MASFWFSLAVIIIIISSCMQSLASPGAPTSSISASPRSLLLTDPPLLSPFEELSPDIAPLLPSPGGVVPTTTGSSIPTIPSSPSPPNPDDIISPGLDSAFAPFGSFPPSSSAAAATATATATAATLHLLLLILQLATFMVGAASWLLQ